eukprot:TRINITY_DN47316_c0_g1_i1.p1 TRINITY_DN47316_c0_g1~~TRINITY_DN47316_c0_g1_i1.p1  ORF type:complete len:673 (-),score=110.23 TRINITY_DN47316_c0_g1_i1:425-2443(-)
MPRRPPSQSESSSDDAGRRRRNGRRSQKLSTPSKVQEPADDEVSDASSGSGAEGPVVSADGRRRGRRRGGRASRELRQVIGRRTERRELDLEPKRAARELRLARVAKVAERSRSPSTSSQSSSQEAASEPASDDDLVAADGKSAASSNSEEGGSITCAECCVFFTLALLHFAFGAMGAMLAKALEPKLTQGQMALVVLFTMSWLGVFEVQLFRLLTRHCFKSDPAIVSALYRATLDEETGKALSCLAELGLYLLYMYICDRTDYFPKGPKNESRAIFWSICGGLLLLSFCSVRACKTKLPLQREQTEEWKGWMQIMFLMYHYWHVKEIYNMIRIYIAAYVWMTGFGNFSFYYIKKDFSLVRFCHMMWRLNFLVFFVCITLQNEYMLYYICALHTAFTLGVYMTLAACHYRNDAAWVIWTKLLIAFLLSYILWNTPGAVKTVFSPLSFLLAYSGDPSWTKKPEAMHEFDFRTTLDHLIWLVGMAYAYTFPCTSKWLERFSDSSTPRRRCLGVLTRVVIAFAAVTALALWYLDVYSRPKRAYNAIHPYTSFIPLTAYLVLRNLASPLREYYLHMWAFLGKTTLETYIAQFHIWMRTTGPNGNPKFLLKMVDNYFLNLGLTSAIFLLVAYRLFCITCTLRDFCVPKEGILGGICALCTVGGLCWLSAGSINAIIA